MSENGVGYINSIIRATNILELYNKLDVEYLGLAEISKELDLHKTTVFRVVKTLEHQGWLRQEAPNGKYRLSSKLITLASAMTHSTSVDDLILQEMRDLRDEYNEDVVLTGLIDDVAVCMEKVQSNNMLRVHSRVGRASNLFKGSTGKTLLAFFPEEKARRILDHHFSDSVEDQEERKHLEQTLQQIREDGFCSTTSEQDPGITSVAVPIFDREGQVRYSLALLGEENRMSQKGLSKLLESLRQSTHRLAEEIDFS